MEPIDISQPSGSGPMALGHAEPKFQCCGPSGVPILFHQTFPSIRNITSCFCMDNSQPIFVHCLYQAFSVGEHLLYLGDSLLSCPLVSPLPSSSIHARLADHLGQGSVLVLRDICGVVSQLEAISLPAISLWLSSHISLHSSGLHSIGVRMHSQPIEMDVAFSPLFLLQ